MSRLLFVLSVMMLIAGCTLNYGSVEVALSEKLGPDKHSITLSSPDRSRCDANLLDDFHFQLFDSGDWQASAKISNIDTRKDASWQNQLAVKLAMKINHGGSQVELLDIASFTIDRRSEQNISESGHWKGGKIYFDRLASPAAAKEYSFSLHHTCSSDR